MHPWIYQFSTYISQQFPHTSNTLQTALVLIQAFLDRHQHFESIEKTCNYLSKFPFKTLNEFVSCEPNCHLNIGPSHYLNTDRSILVACFKEDVSSKTGEILLQDVSSSIPACLISIDAKDLNVPLFIIHAVFITEDEKVTFRNQLGSVKYVELNSWVKKGTDLDETLCIKQVDYLTVSRYTKLTIKPKYVNVKGIVINKSPVHKVHGHNPFFFINLQCSDNPSVVVPVVVQGCTHVHWYAFLKLFQYVLITKLKLTVVGKGKKDERQVRCTSTESTQVVLSQDSVGDMFENSMNIFSNIGPSDGAISYMGLITDNQFSEFGLYVLDDRVKLLISHQPQLHFGKGYRVGAQLHAVDVHPINHKNELVLCCCTKSCIEMIEFASQETSYIANPFSSACHKFTVYQYLWMVDVIKEIKALLPAHFKLSNTEWANIQPALQNFIVPVIERPSVFSEFLDVPHSCIFTLPANRHEREPLPHLWGVQELVDFYEQAAEEEAFQGSWLTGTEYDRFQYHNATNWTYAVIEPQRSQQKFLFGFITSSFGHLKLTDKTGTIYIVITGENEHLIDQFLLIHSYKIVVEKSCYEELIKQTGRTTEKSMCRIYIMCTLKDIDVMTSHTSRDKFLTNGKRKSENVLEESIKKQICSVKGISNDSCTTSTMIIARQFKRQHVGYDVEVHSEDQIFVPGLGRVDSSEICEKCISLYPFTTSNLILRLQDVDTKKMTALYIDANNLPYNFAYLPGAVITLKNVVALTSKSGSTYYKLKRNSKMELIELPPPFERLQHIMAEVEESRKNCTERKYLIDFVKDGFQKEKNKNLKDSDMFRCVGRISLVLNITAKWVCSDCLKETGASGRCTPGCKQKRRAFRLEARCCVGDGTAESYLFVEEPFSSKLFSLSQNDVDFLRSTTYRCGAISYNRDTASKEMIENIENSSKKRQCEYMLLKHSNAMKISRLFEFYLKPFQLKEIEPGFPSCVLVSGKKEYHSLTYRKLTFKCVTFQTVNYKQLLSMSLHEEKFKSDRRIGGT